MSELTCEQIDARTATDSIKLLVDRLEDSAMTATPEELRQDLVLDIDALTFTLKVLETYV